MVESLTFLPRLFAYIFMLLILPACGKLSLSLTDAPVDSAEKVVLVFTGLEIQPENDSLITIDYSESKSIDLMTLTDGVTESLLTDEVLAEGKYSWIKLKLDIANSYVTIDGADYPLRIPEEDESGLQITQTFSISFSGGVKFIIDFDLRKSLYDPEGTSEDYVLRPDLRMVDEAEAGSISGIVDDSLISADSDCVDNSGAINAVLYVFNSHGIKPDDIDGDAPILVTSANVKPDFSYNIAYLNVNDYTISLTCEADQDDPAANDIIKFIENKDVTVNARQDSVVNFGL